MISLYLSLLLQVYFKTTHVQKGAMIPAKSMKMNGSYKCGAQINQFQNDIATLTLSKPKTDITPIKLECRK